MTPTHILRLTPNVHQELEDLLETYFAQIDHSHNRLEVLKEVIQDTEDYVNIDLDAQRNKILELNVLVGLAAVVHGIASCAYGVFGMNFLLDAEGNASGLLIPNPGKNDKGAFRAVTIAVAAVCFLAWLVLVAMFRRRGFLHIVTLPGVAPQPHAPHAPRAPPTRPGTPGPPGGGGGGGGVVAVPAGSLHKPGW